MCSSDLDRKQIVGEPPGETGMNSAQSMLGSPECRARQAPTVQARKNHRLLFNAALVLFDVPNRGHQSAGDLLFRQGPPLLSSGRIFRLLARGRTSLMHLTEVFAALSAFTDTFQGQVSALVRQTLVCLFT